MDIFNKYYLASHTCMTISFINYWYLIDFEMFKEGKNL